MLNLEQLDRYINPPIPPKNDTIYKSYSHFSSIGHGHNEEDVIYVEKPNPADYPREAGYSRIPVMVNCSRCNHLGMSEIEYTHGCASKVWCVVLLPFLCTGACCLCLNSCKDVEHKCSNCHERVGINQSNCC